MEEAGTNLDWDEFPPHAAHCRCVKPARRDARTSGIGRHHMLRWSCICRRRKSVGRPVGLLRIGLLHGSLLQMMGTSSGAHVHSALQRMQPAAGAHMHSCMPARYLVRRTLAVSLLSRLGAVVQARSGSLTRVHGCHAGALAACLAKGPGAVARARNELRALRELRTTGRDACGASTSAHSSSFGCEGLRLQILCARYRLRSVLLSGEAVPEPADDCCRLARYKLISGRDEGEYNMSTCT